MLTALMCVSSLVGGFLAASSPPAVAQQPYPDLKGSWIGPGQAVTDGKTDHWSRHGRDRTGLSRGLLDPRRRPAGGEPVHGLAWADRRHAERDHHEEHRPDGLVDGPAADNEAAADP